MLSSLIRLRPLVESSQPEPEDIFTSSLGLVFTDDAQNMHGDPDNVVIYKSSNFGEIDLGVADPKGEEERRKFAHYLWNAGVLMGELVGGRPGRFTDGNKSSEWWVGQDEEKLWNVHDKTVLELGAGVGLAGIISTLAGAYEVVISDYPAPDILRTLRKNVDKNLVPQLRRAVKVEGHQWGNLKSQFASEKAGHFTRVLAADCLWMPHEHENLARSMLHFLSPSPEARVLVIAGFHTGRRNLVLFFEEVVQEEGLQVESIYEMDVDGRRREWSLDRGNEEDGISERKKWLVVARLRRRNEATLAVS